MAFYFVQVVKALLNEVLERDEKWLFSHEFVPMQPLPIGTFFRFLILKSERGFVYFAEHEYSNIMIAMLHKKYIHDSHEFDVLKGQKRATFFFNLTLCCQLPRLAVLLMPTRELPNTFENCAWVFSLCCNNFV